MLLGWNLVNNKLYNINYFISEMGSTVDIISPGHHRSGRSEQNIVVVCDSVAVIQ